MNLLKLNFASWIIFIIISGILIGLIEPYLPKYFVQFIRYGKFSYKGTPSKLISLIEVPKRWFQHMYLFAFCLITVAYYQVINYEIFENQVPTWVKNWLYFISSDSTPKASPMEVLFAMTIFFIQISHRLHETWMVSVYSNSRINISHYALGYFHYMFVISAILSEANGFTNHTEPRQILRMNDITLGIIVGSGISLWAVWQQAKHAKLLANLRKNKEGRVTTYKHLIPTGQWFESVSSPHNLAEILIYFGITIVLWKTTIFHYVTIWVLVNQIETALLTHWWYLENFKEYPKSRKAIFPYIF